MCFHCVTLQNIVYSTCSWHPPSVVRGPLSALWALISHFSGCGMAGVRSPSRLTSKHTHICLIVTQQTQHLNKICTMLDQRRRRCANVVQMVCFLFTGKSMLGQRRRLDQHWSNFGWTWRVRWFTGTEAISTRFDQIGTQLIYYRFWLQNASPCLCLRPSHKAWGVVWATPVSYTTL